jgi:hypothetical protein
MENRQSKILATGAIGEGLVMDYLLESGQYDSVEYSDNQYDMHKDLIAVSSGKRNKVEVKTRTVIRKYHAMPLEQSQWYKADNADILYFVVNPTSMDEKIRIYETKGDECYRIVSDFGPRRIPTRMYDLSKMKLVKTIDDPEKIKEFYDLTTSSYKQ